MGKVPASEIQPLTTCVLRGKRVPTSDGPKNPVARILISEFDMILAEKLASTIRNVGS
jgi:hypothetical protein